ncbi:hypothetical protein [Paraflavitalea sp. CAU 1676]|uniref:hypothetical protein n=1 Tax=Paraflavitalea sp. CAU 1676 TaxID=3032598 RepID=UPI0023DA56CF|nr:hypothetical protein [Paraflavitalea sp. CAU 1676]MDF2189226.1 hypothetical protein [Paraflavitalea sp. CAU 1676]
MSQSILYLVPTQEFPIGDFQNIIQEYLTKNQLIDGLYSEEYGWLAAGDNAGGIFLDSEGAFEYAEIRDSKNLRLVPEEVGPDFTATCVYCGSGLGAILYEKVAEFYENEGEEGSCADFGELSIQCNSCSQSQSITALKLPEDRLLSRQFIQFVEIDSEANPAFIGKLEALLQCELIVIYV